MKRRERGWRLDVNDVEKMRMIMAFNFIASR